MNNKITTTDPIHTDDKSISASKWWKKFFWLIGMILIPEWEYQMQSHIVSANQKTLQTSIEYLSPSQTSPK